MTAGLTPSSNQLHLFIHIEHTIPILSLCALVHAILLCREHVSSTLYLSILQVPTCFPCNSLSLFSTVLVITKILLLWTLTKSRKSKFVLNCPRQSSCRIIFPLYLDHKHLEIKLTLIFKKPTATVVWYHNWALDRLQRPSVLVCLKMCETKDVLIWGHKNGKPIPRREGNQKEEERWRLCKASHAGET